MQRTWELEVCVDRIDDAVCAVEAGATRIEFNQALALDGLTPDLEQCRWLVDNVSAPVVAMLRPHADGFHYTALEQACMLRTCDQLMDCGVSGIAFGAVDKEQELDWNLLEQIRKRSPGREFVLHRVIDTLPGRLELVRRLIDLGVDRVLTSGGAKRAIDAIQELDAMQRKAGEQMNILVGAGVDCQVVKDFVAKTCCRQFHGSFRLGASQPNKTEIAATAAFLESQAADSKPA